MKDRGAWGILVALSLAALAAASTVRFDTFWGDAATYHAMGWSLAHDYDLRYEPGDIYRIRREYPKGPQGLFLKKAHGGLTPDGPGFVRRVDEARLYYAKPFLYPLVAAPLVRVMGTRGFYVLNGLSLAAALLLGYAACRRTRSPAASLVLVVAIFAGTVVPLYLVWLAPEMFYLGLAAAALALWRLDRPALAAVLLGAAAYGKPPNVFLAIPLLAAPLVDPELRLVRRLIESARRGVLLLLTTLLFFGWNVALTGEWNYQAGERKTFYGRFPFEMGEVKGVPTALTFGNSGFWMTTPDLGPQADEDEGSVPTPRTEPPRPAAELRTSFRYNLIYFWVGRFGGVAPYFLPVAVAAMAFLLVASYTLRGALTVVLLAASWAAALLVLPEAWYGGGHPMKFVLLAAYAVPAVAAALVWSRLPVDREAALAFAALLVTQAFYLWMIPDDWYGNGNLGNRYFLTLVPLALFFAPRGAEAGAAVAAVLSAAILLRPLFLAPLHHSTRSQGVHVTRPVFRAFPLELTMLNDLTIFGETWRKKQAVGDTGDEHKHWPAEPDAYWLYFPDDGTYGRESHDGQAGFWLRGGETAEVVLRAGLVSNDVHRIHIEVTGGPAGDDVEVRAEGEAARLSVAAGQKAQAVFEAGPGLPYKETVLYGLRFRSSRGGPDAAGRVLGGFVRIALDVERPRK